MICDRNQRIFRPAAEPVHCTSTYQARELQWTVSEFFPNLGGNKIHWAAALIGSKIGLKLYVNMT